MGPLFWQETRLGALLRGLGEGMIVGIADQPTHAELLAELEALRAENARLRGLLGLDARGDDLAVAG